MFVKRIMLWMATIGLASGTIWLAIQGPQSSLWAACLLLSGGGVVVSVLALRSGHTDSTRLRREIAEMRKERAAERAEIRTMIAAFDTLRRGFSHEIGRLEQALAQDEEALTDA